MMHPSDSFHTLFLSIVSSSSKVGGASLSCMGFPPVADVGQAWTRSLILGAVDVRAGSGDRDCSELPVLPSDPWGEGESVGDVDRDGEGMLE